MFNKRHNQLESLETTAKSLKIDPNSLKTIQNHLKSPIIRKPPETAHFKKETNQVKLQEEFESDLSISLPL